MAPEDSGYFTYNYTVVADQTPVSLRATLNYVKPISLQPSVAIALGQYGGAVRFNIGRGGGRLGDKDLSFTPNTWEYVAMAVDVPNLAVTYYVYDPVYGIQSNSAVLTSAFVSALNGLGNGFSLNEDGDGGYGPNYRNGDASNTIGGRFDYGEFGTWNRALTKTEVESIGRSGTSLTTLLP